jgi:TRAP-type C4-dicarboxylate transport system permease small subunit
MLRQRVRSRKFRIARIVADTLVVIFALALIWGGAMLVLLAFKTSPATIEDLSGYRSAYDYLAGLEPQDISASTRLTAAVGGLIACLIFGYLAWRAVPRPYLARTDLRLVSDERGIVEVNPRAIERAAEIAVLAHPDVAAVGARYATDDLTVEISASRADALAATLQDVHRRARESLVQHELPVLPVNVTLVRFERNN